MPDIHPIVSEEQHLLAGVRQRLLEHTPEAGASEADILQEMDRIREEIRGAKLEDHAALEQQYEHLTRLAEQIRKGKPQGEVDPDSPYFAHLRLQQEGRTSEIFLGKATCLDGGLRIVDWRHAPIARLYYRYEEGDPYEEDLGHRTLTGEILARRTVSVSRGNLERVAAPQGTFVREGDDWHQVSAQGMLRVDPSGNHVWHTIAAGQWLGVKVVHRADKHLPDIAALIDKEQFTLISRPDSGPVILRGGAGSGKTTVALHRIAYLNYANRQRFSVHRMVVVVWGKALRDYVSKVLPNLGVKGVPVTTWAEWSRRLVARHFPHLPDHANANTPSVISRLKLHPGLPRLLEQLVRSRPAPATLSSALDDWRMLISDSAHLRALGGFTDKEINEAMNHIRSQLAQLALLEERDRSAEPWLDEEDDAILLRAWQLRVGPLKAREGGPVRYAHIAVDEAQDFSAMELSVLLGCLDEKKCITLAGDTQQHIQQVGGSTDWSEMLEQLGITSMALSTLRISYRSTRTITGFARMLLGELAEDDAPLATRDGRPVEIFPFPDHGACVAFMGRVLQRLVATEPLASVALIAPDAEIADLYAQGLATMDIPNLRRVVDQTFSFTPGIDIVEVKEVKGLEFDYVVILEASAKRWPDRPHYRRLLHVAATRAIHQLWITHVEAATSILPAIQ